MHTLLVKGMSEEWTPKKIVDKQQKKTDKEKQSEAGLSRKSGGRFDIYSQISDLLGFYHQLCWWMYSDTTSPPPPPN